jgi:hypothetical protein
MVSVQRAALQHARGRDLDRVPGAERVDELVALALVGEGSLTRVLHAFQESDRLTLVVEG